MLPTKHTRFTWAALLLATTCLLIAGERVRGILGNTCWLAVATVAIALPIGLLVAMLLMKTNMPCRRVLLAAFAVLLFMPLYLHAAGWQAALGVTGWFTARPAGQLSQPWIDGWRGAIWIHAMAAVPWVVCIVAGALRWLPSAAEEAASLAAHPLRVLRSITLPAIAPTVGVAALWVAVSAAAEMTVTDFFQIRTFAEEVYTSQAMGGFQTDTPSDDYQPIASFSRGSGLVAGVSVLAVLAMIALVHFAAAISRLEIAGRQTVWRWRMHAGRWLAAACVAAVLLMVAGIPVISLLYKAGLGTQQTESGWQRVWLTSKLNSELSQSVSLYWQELVQSLTLGLAVATATAAIGLVAGWALRTGRYQIALLGVFAVAIATPGPLLALAVIPLINHPNESILSPLTWAYDYTLFAPWLVQTIRFVPIASLVFAAGFANVPNSLLDAARADGATWWGRMLRIGLPMNISMAAVAWLVVFALSAGELAATVLVMPPGTPTLTIRLFQLLHYGIEDRVAAVSVVLLASVSLVAVMALWLSGRSRLWGNESV